MRRAVLIASSQFEDKEFQTLQFPVRDAERFGAVLRDTALCDFEEVVLLVNDTIETARKALDRAARSSAPGDLLLFYYSGHGKLDRDGALALVMPHSESEILGATALISDELKRMFNLSRASQKIMILDCCFSGSAGAEGFKGADPIDSLAHNLSGSFLLTASRRFERALELEEQQAGALTDAIVQGVKTGCASPPSSDHVTLNELASYARKAVSANTPQVPEYWDSGGIGGLVFSKKLPTFDAAWVTRARTLVTQNVSKRIFDEDIAEDIRAVLASNRRSRHVHRLQLIDGLMHRRTTVSAFTTAWLSAGDEEAGEPSRPPPRPDSIPPARPKEPSQRAGGGDPRSLWNRLAAIARSRPHRGMVAIGLFILVMIPVGLMIGRLLPFPAGNDLAPVNEVRNEEAANIAINSANLSTNNVVAPSTPPVNVSQRPAPPRSSSSESNNAPMYSPETNEGYPPEFNTGSLNEQF